MQIHLPAKWHKRFTVAIIIALLVSVFLSVFTHNLLILFAAPVIIVWLFIIFKPSILYYLLILAIPFSTELKVTATLGTDFPDEMLMWILSLGTITMLVFKPSLLKPGLLKHPLILLLILHFCWIIVAVIYSNSPLLSLKYAAAKTWYILCFVFATFIFVNSENRVKLVSGLLVFSVLFTALIIMIRHGLNDFSFETVSQVTRPFYRNHVNYAAMLVCVIPIALGGYYLARKHKLTWILTILLMVSALALSYSRGAWLAIFAGALTALAVKYRVVAWLYTVLFITVLASVFYFSNNNRYLDYRPDFFSTIYHEDFREHMQATYQFRDLSTAERFYRWIAAIRMMEGQWVTGYGPNNFYPNYKRFGVTDFRTYVSDNPEKSTVHNYFLLLLTEQGIPGLVIFLLLLFCMLMNAQRIYHHTENRFHKTVCLVITSMLGIITVLISLSDLIETDKIGSLFFLSLGMLLVVDNSEKGGQKIM